MFAISKFELPLRIDGDARPAEFRLEIIGIAEPSIVVRADIDEYSISLTLEEIPEHPLLLVFRVGLRTVRALKLA
jgi:hypothetical protein